MDTWAKLVIYAVLFTLLSFSGMYIAPNIFNVWSFAYGAIFGIIYQALVIQRI